MNRNRRLCWVVLAFVVLVSGCSHENGNGGAGDTDGKADTDTDADADMDADSDTNGETDTDSDTGTDMDMDTDTVFTGGVNYPAVDDLGRELPTYEEVGPLRPDKYVAMFFWTWHVGHSQSSKNYNLQEIITDSAMVNDWDHPSWAPYADGSSFFWGESIYGYYDGKDKWVIRKQLELLGAAGVDALFYDNTNGSFDWKEGYEAVAQVMAEARADGVSVPKFAFMLNFGPIEETVVSLVKLYDDLYSQGRYQDSWFIWDGKPVIMAYPEALNSAPKAQTAGMRFSASEPFTGISLGCPSWSNNIGNLTLRLYAWDTNYATSVAGLRLAEQKFVDFSDNQYLELTFAEHTAGDYLAVLSEATETVGVWKYIEETGGVTSYFNGVEVSGDYRSQIRYSSAGAFKDLTTGNEETKVPMQISEGGYDPTKLSAIRDFFTFRPGQPAYEGGPTRNDQWGWLENAPQNGYVEKSPGKYEFMTVGTAQNWSEQTNGLSAMNGPQIHGRSYTAAEGFSKLTADSYLYGYNFQEQWARALSVDPEIVFITGWNEWVMGRFETWQGVENAFPDQYNIEYSRDIEPMKGGFGDNYYYQLVSNIRRFKGMQQPRAASPERSIVVDGDFTEWDQVRPVFSAIRGNTRHRDGTGYLDRDNPTAALHYTNETGRNDIVQTRVARNGTHVYFYVQTAQALTSHTDAQWMQLLIDIDRDRATGWEGYDFLIDGYTGDGQVALNLNGGGWSWSEIARGSYAVSENELEIAVPRSALGLDGGASVDLELKWLDNVDAAGDIMSFYLYGDVAPLGRFNFHFFE